MEQKIEGLVLSKTLLKRRDIIARLLLRNGKKVSISFSGGNKSNVGLVESAHMLKVDIAPFKSHAQLYRAKEWNVLWASSNIRSDYPAFSVACLILEILQSVTIVSDLYDSAVTSDNEFFGIFSVASNALYRLDMANNEPHTHLLPFLGKLLIALGVFPRIDNCPECNKSLAGMKQMVLDANQGGFLCRNCLFKNKSSSYASEIKLHAILKEIAYKKYREVSLCGNRALFGSLLDYFCHQFELSRNHFKSLPAALQTFPLSF